MPAHRLHPIAALGIAAALAACSPQTDKHTAASAAAPAAANGQTVKLLNVSYDVARDFYKDYNPLFEKEYAAKHPGSAKASAAAVATWVVPGM